MKNYNPIEKIISNENVIHILSGAKLPGEGDLLAEVLEETENKSIIKIYVVSRSYSSTGDKLIYLAKVIKKKNKIGITEWYVNLEGKWKVDIS